MSETNNVALKKYLTDLRARENLNQLELAEKLKDHIKISQSTISAYEQGKKSPNANNLKLLRQALEKVFGSEGIETLRKTDNVNLKSPNLGKIISEYLSSDKLMEEAEYFLNKNNHQHNLWFVGNEKLPITTHVEFKKLWERMLKKGVDYNIIIFTDKLYKNKPNYREDIASFNKLISAIREIAENIKITEEEITNYGRIRIYCVAINESTDNPLEVNESTDNPLEVNESINDLNNSYELFESVTLNRKSLNKSYINLMQTWQSFAAISIYVPKKSGYESAANLRIANVKSSLYKDDKDKEEAFFWFDSNTSQGFSDTIKEFEEDLNVKQQQDARNV